MQGLLAALTLALAGQLTEGTRYAEQPTGEAAAPAATAPSQLTFAEEAAVPEQAAPASGLAAPSADTTQPDVAGQAAIASSAPAVDPTAPPESLSVHQEPAATQPAEAPQRSVLAAGPKPSDLMHQLVKSPAASQLMGMPITLGEAVRDARSRQDQTVRAKAYWNLAAATADYYLALLEDTELGVLRQSIAAPGKQWDVRQREAQARVEIALRSAEAAQLQLHQLLGRGPSGSLPLPGDAPHCGRYNAEYEEIFGQQPHAIAKQLSDLMPLRYSTLRAQSQAIADAAAWREEMSRRRDPASEGLELLNAQELLSHKRREFIATARDYNQEIAAYTELAAPAEVAPERLVAMMIRTAATTDRLPWQPSGVQQAAAEEPASPDVAALPPAAESRDVEVSSVQQANATEERREVRRPLQRILDGEREHSIVSRIRKLRDRIIE
jgi:hypothetical protein